MVTFVLSTLDFYPKRLVIKKSWNRDCSTDKFCSTEIMKCTHNVAILVRFPEFHLFEWREWRPNCVGSMTSACAWRVATGPTLLWVLRAWTCVLTCVKWPLLPFDINRNWSASTLFGESHHHLMSRKFMQLFLTCHKRTDRHTGRSWHIFTTFSCHRSYKRYFYPYQFLNKFPGWCNWKQRPNDEEFKFRSYLKKKEGFIKTLTNWSHLINAYSNRNGHVSFSWGLDVVFPTRGQVPIKTYGASQDTRAMQSDVVPD
jgi:hypothetical protein